jgi:hypothetical protein
MHFVGLYTKIIMMHGHLNIKYLQIVFLRETKLHET